MMEKPVTLKMAQRDTKRTSPYTRVLTLVPWAMAAQRQDQSILKPTALTYPITMPLPPPVLQPISEAVSLSDDESFS
jgi:hypothetical protein